MYVTIFNLDIIKQVLVEELFVASSCHISYRLKFLKFSGDFTRFFYEPEETVAVFHKNKAFVKKTIV